MNDDRGGAILPLKLLFITAGLLIGFLVSRIFLVPYQIPDNAMEPAVPGGSYVLLLKTTPPGIGDIVLIEHPEDPDDTLLLRVTAADEARIEMRNKVLYVNERKFTPPWKVISRDKRVFPLHFSKRDIMPPMRLRRGEYFLTADNADRGYDSRYFGPVHEDSIIGKVIYIH